MAELPFERWPFRLSWEAKALFWGGTGVWPEGRLVVLKVGGCTGLWCMLLSTGPEWCME